MQISAYESAAPANFLLIDFVLVVETEWHIMAKIVLNLRANIPALHIDTYRDAANNRQIIGYGIRIPQGNNDIYQQFLAQLNRYAANANAPLPENIQALEERVIDENDPIDDAEFNIIDAGVDENTPPPNGHSSTYRY